MHAAGILALAAVAAVGVTVPVLVPGSTDGDGLPEGVVGVGVGAAVVVVAAELIESVDRVVSMAINEEEGESGRASSLGAHWCLPMVQ